MSRRDAPAQSVTDDQKEIPSGAEVSVRLDVGSIFETTTRSAPWQLGHGAWVVLLEGKTGGYDLSRVTRRCTGGS